MAVLGSWEYTTNYSQANCEAPSVSIINEHHYELKMEAGVCDRRPEQRRVWPVIYRRLLQPYHFDLQILTLLSETNWHNVSKTLYCLRESAHCIVFGYLDMH